MGARARALRRVFQKGVSSLSRDELEQLFRQTRGKIYRFDNDVDELAEIGFDLNRNAKGALGKIDDDIPGLFFGDRPATVYEFHGGEPGRVNVKGIRRPGASVAKVLGQGADDPRLSLGDSIPDADFLDLAHSAKKLDPDELAELLASHKARWGKDLLLRDVGNKTYAPYVETVQQKPGNTLARIKKSSGEVIYRILGLLGALQMMKEQEDGSPNTGDEERRTGH